VNKYEKSINNDYTIIIVTKQPLNKSKVSDLKNLEVKNIEHIQREKILGNLKKDLSNGSYKLLEKRLPYFYKIYLETFPTTSMLELIKKDLKTIKNIKSIETFSKDHDTTYSMLLLIKTLILFLFISIILFTFLLMLNHVKIWFFEHTERLDIIQLHGGSIFYAAKPIIKIAVYSSLFSSITVLLLSYLVSQNISVIFNFEIISVIKENMIQYSILDIASIFIISILVSFMTVFGILIKHRLK
jgi:cell division transport system permease protein